VHAHFVEPKTSIFVCSAFLFQVRLFQIQHFNVVPRLSGCRDRRSSRRETTCMAWQAVTPSDLR
jgi:hypothetical protein